MGERIASGPCRLEPGPIPLYYRLEQDLRERIETGEFAPGTALPTEDRVCEQYGVSRITARRAFDKLLQQGLIFRKRGVGSFVTEPVHGMDSRLSGSLNEFLSSAMQLKTRWLSLDRRAAPVEVTKQLGLEDDSSAHLLKTIGAMDGVPVAYLEIWFPPAIGERLDLSDGNDNIPVIRVVERKFGFMLTRAKQSVEADFAGVDAGYHLGISARTPILKVKRTYYAGDRPVETACVRYHPDRYRYAIDFR